MRDIGARHPSERQLRQRCEVFAQVALDISEASRFQAGAARIEVELDCNLHRARGMYARRSLLDLWVGPEMNLGKDTFRPLARFFRSGIGDGADRDSPLLFAKTVLRDPGALPAVADTKSEAGELVIEKQFVAGAVRERQPLDRCLGELHGFAWEAHGKHPSDAP